MSPSKLAATQTGTFPAARAPRSRQHAGRVWRMRLIAIPQRRQRIVAQRSDLISRVMVKRNSASHVEHNAHNLLIAACAVCAHNRATASADT
jgi:hypothetical protein